MPSMLIKPVRTDTIQVKLVDRNVNDSQVKRSKAELLSQTDATPVASFRVKKIFIRNFIKIKCEK